MAVKPPKVAAAWSTSRPRVLEFLVGKAMAATSGRADPQVLRELFKEWQNSGE